MPCLLDELCATVKAAGAEQLLIDVAGPVPFVIAGEALDLLADGNALVEFEGEDFAWVKYADSTDSEQPGSDAQDSAPSESDGQAPERQ